MNKVTQFINKETTYFRKLSSAGQKLMYSIFLFELIGPIMGIFINAFLWRETQDIVLISLYNLLIFSTVYFGFVLNGLLLKYFSINTLYSVSLLLRVLLISTLIFLPQITYVIIIAFGLFEGILAGMYWGNRNLLTLKATTSNDRIYFSSVESVSSTISDIAVPVSIGWFIALGTILHLYAPDSAYKTLCLIMLVTTGIFAWLMTSFSIDLKTITKRFLTKTSASWNKFRILQFILGFSDGARSFVPALMVLLLVGNEAALGTVQSLAAVLSAIVIYFLGKSLQIKHRMLLLQISIVIGIIGAIVFGFTFSALGVIVFFAFQALANPFSWVAIQSLNYDLIEKQDTAPENHYAYVCDQEIYLCSGRVAAIASFLWIVLTFSSDTALRFAPIMFAAAQIFLLLIAKSIEKKEVI